MRRVPRDVRSLRPAIGLALATTILATGCVERLLQVRTDPPGAEVFVNGKKIEGVTPADHPFSFYGTVSVVLRREGYESRRELVTLSPPWYEYFPLDFFAEFLVPWRLRDHHLLEVQLVPQPSADDDLQTLRTFEVLQEQAERARESVRGPPR